MYAFKWTIWIKLNPHLHLHTGLSAEARWVQQFLGAIICALPTPPWLSLPFRAPLWGRVTKSSQTESDCRAAHVNLHAACESPWLCSEPKWRQTQTLHSTLSSIWGISSVHCRVTKPSRKLLLNQWLRHQYPGNWTRPSFWHFYPKKHFQLAEVGWRHFQILWLSREFLEPFSRMKHILANYFLRGCRNQSLHTQTSSYSRTLTCQSPRQSPHSPSLTARCLLAWSFGTHLCFHTIYSFSLA